MKYLGVSDVDFDPENGSRKVQLAIGVINQLFVPSWRNMIIWRSQQFLTTKNMNRMTIELHAYASAAWNARLMLNATLGLVTKPQYLSSPNIEQIS